MTTRPKRHRRTRTRSPRNDRACLQLLERRGYRLDVGTYEDDEGDIQFWYEAERDGFTFAADNPIELAGLAALYEDVRPTADVPYWWSAKNDRSAPPGHPRDTLIERAIERQEAVHAQFETQRQEDPDAWEAAVRRAFDDGYDVSNSASFLGVWPSVLRRWLEDPRLTDLRSRPSRSRSRAPGR